MVEAAALLVMLQVGNPVPDRQPPAAGVAHHEPVGRFLWLAEDLSRQEIPGRPTAREALFAGPV